MSKRNSRTYWPGDKQRGKNRTWPPQRLEIHGNPYENRTREPAPSQPSCWLLQHQASHEVKGNTACHIWTSTLVQTSSNFPKSSKTLSGPSWGQTSRCASSDARHGNHTEASCGCRQQHAQLARSSSRSPFFRSSDVIAIQFALEAFSKYDTTSQHGNCQNNANRPFLTLPACTCFQTMPKPCVHSRWAWSFAAFAALRAAPVLLRRWPCLGWDWFRRGLSQFCQLQMIRTIPWASRMPWIPWIPDTMKHEFLIRCAEEVVQGSLAVKWVFASSMNFTASFLRQVGQTAVSSETLLDTHQFERTSIQVILSAWVHGWVLDGAGSANVTLDLHLAVGQLARICLAGEGCGLYKRHQTNQTHCGRLSPASPHLWSEHIILRPVDAVNALGTLSCKFRKRTNHDNCKHMGTHSSWEINKQCPKHVPKQGCVTSCELCDVV